ncbi:MAG TPA: hypothetical protein DCE55_07165 [Planctomycetaceae bacterium]|nr:hypothetical protein [Planctomycetaceae bacterium]
MLIAQGFDPIFVGVSDWDKAIAVAVALLFLIYAVPLLLVIASWAPPRRSACWYTWWLRRNGWPEGSTGPRVPD